MENPHRKNEEERQQEQQEELAIRSKPGTEKSFVRFVNKTKYIVGVYWIDYKGESVNYKTLRYANYFDADTFAEHPWIFIDEETKDRYLGNGKKVFLPEPLHDKRKIVVITLPMYTLRDLCLRVIKRRLRHDQDAFCLELPSSLQRELFALHPRKPENSNA